MSETGADGERERERGNSDEPMGNLLPMYFVVDESRSMQPDMETLNESMMQLLDEVHGNPMAAAKVRLAVVGFSDTAHMYLEPSDLRDIEVMPLLEARGKTIYGAAFDLLKEHVESDAVSLKQQGFSVFRPTVFFLTDGAPNDRDWREAHSRLVDPEFAYRPNILSFGFGRSDQDVICDIATSPQFAFQAQEGMAAGDALQEFFSSLTNSVIQSGLGAARGELKLEVDEAPAGFLSLAIGEVEALGLTVERLP